MNGSTSTAVAVVAALRRGGVADVVLAPGSRSAALALALHQADDDRVLRLHVRIDERSAGFLALGLAKGSAIDRSPSSRPPARPSPTCTPLCSKPGTSVRA